MKPPKLTSENQMMPSYLKRLLRPEFCLALLLSLLPPLLVLREIQQEAYNMPFWDQWDVSVPIALAAKQGELNLNDLAAQHNEHRIVFTNLLTAFLSLTINWDLKVEMGLVVGLAGLCYLLLLSLYWRTWPRLLLMIAPVFSALIFSLSQYEIWLWSFSSQWYFVLLFFLMGIWLLVYWPIGWRALLAAGLMAFSASFSFGGGLLVWPSLSLLLLLRGYRKIIYYGAWLVGTLATLALYFNNYHFPERHGGDLWLQIRLFLAYLGNPFVETTSPFVNRAILLGLLGLVALLLNLGYLLRRDYTWQALAPWLSLAVFAIGSGILSAWGRFDPNYGLHATLSPRYVSFGNVFWWAVLALSVASLYDFWGHQAERGAMARWLVGANIVLLAALFGFYLDANQEAQAVSWHVKPHHVSCLHAYSATAESTCLAGLHPALDPNAYYPVWRNALFNRIDDLDQAKLGPFRE